MEVAKCISRPPYFDGNNYDQWREHMKIFIQSVDYKLWLNIKNGPKIPKKQVEGQEVEKSEDEFDDEDMRNMEQDSRAKNILIRSMNEEAFRMISDCETAKQIWDKLLDNQEGTSIGHDQNSTIPQGQPTYTVVNSSQFNLPVDVFSDETGEDLRRLCVALYKHALEGNWAAAKRIITEKDERLKHAAISRGWSTLLHVAAGAGPSDAHFHFVEQLIGMLLADDHMHIQLQDLKGNTAFCFAAAAGDVRVVDFMLTKNRNLPLIRGGGGLTPVHFATLQGRCEMAHHLYDKTDRQLFEDKDWKLLFFASINTGNYGLALRMAQEKPTLLAKARENDDEQGETALHLLAQKPLDSCCQCQHHSPIRINPAMKQQRVDLQLVKHLWDTIRRYANSRDEITQIINEPFQLLFVAAKVGNFGFLSELISADPSLIWETDDGNRSILHIAVMYRQASIYNLIHEIGAQKDIILTYTDNNDNTLLHLAARLAPQSSLEQVAGAAFQMCLELQWYKEVEKTMSPSFIKMKNSEGLTARQLFTQEHADLRRKAEPWMKGTAEQGMLISTVIATGVFSAAISIPGGISDKTQEPNYLEKTSFLVFAISDAAAFILSATSILIFLSILVSRYAEYDFYKSLPLKLICGLVTLFFSITSMMVAFGSAFFITYYHGLKWIPGFISAFACVPIFLFIYLQFSLWSEILFSTYYCKNLFKPGKRRMLYVLDE